MQDFGFQSKKLYLCTRKTVLKPSNIRLTLQIYIKNMVKTRKMTRIFVDKSKIEKLMTKFDCGRATVYNALSYRTNSDMAEKIRNEALNRYGGVPNRISLPAR